MDKIKVGIFFGGPSREREISFAGGRTVYDNLNKSIFIPVPIFIDSNKKMVVLDWHNVYKGTIRDFYPPVQFLPDSKHAYQIYIESLGNISDDQYTDIISKVGQPIEPYQLSSLIDVAFLALHGYYGEDGQIQSILESLNIPYTGSGVLPCALGMDKSEQKKFMEIGGFACPHVISLSRKDWSQMDKHDLLHKISVEIGTSLVIRPANQGSSIGVSILHNASNDEILSKIEKAFFTKTILATEWTSMDEGQQVEYIRTLSDIRDGLGFPIDIEDQTIYHPEELLTYLTKHFQLGKSNLLLQSHLSESKVIIESFIKGREFSCIVIRNENGNPVALPPTEIKKQGQLYDYRSKYLPGLSRKITPIDLPEENIQLIRSECEKLYSYLSFNTYARIDGFYTESGEIFLNDPNTTSGMMPSSFFFHQAAEIGLDPSQFLSYIIRASLEERMESSLVKTNIKTLIDRLDTSLASLQNASTEKIKVAVILGGYSFERHISVESGRNIYEKLASSEKYSATPIFLMGHEDGSHSLYQIPINLLLKDNADDIKEKILHFSRHKLVDQIKGECNEIYTRFRSLNSIEEPKLITYNDLAAQMDVAFIALHGRPGEDGEVQQNLESVGLPYNGSPPYSAAITINKFDTLERLKASGFTTTKQYVVQKIDFDNDSEKTMDDIEAVFDYPFLVKPVDDGCSSAVRILRNRYSLRVYLEGILRDKEDLEKEMRDALMLSYNEEFPKKNEVLVEQLITSGGAQKFLEITGGMLTKFEDGETIFEVFEPSEALAGGEILSLEEKFLAGEGQNITPARFSPNHEQYSIIASQVKADLEKAAKILGVEGYARIDAFVRIFPDLKTETIIIEVNSLPGMTPATCIFHQCAINGYKPHEFIDKILTYAIQRHEYNK